MKIKYFLFFLFIVEAIHSFALSPDSTSGSWNIQFRCDYGFIIAHRPALLPVQESHVKGFELTLAQTTNGKNVWENTYNFPGKGITLAIFNLGSPSHLGNGIAVYPFVDFPLGKSNEEGLHFRFGMGLGYVEKIFDPKENFKNAAVGNHLNGIIHFDLHGEKKISPHSFLELGSGITHFSNGSYSIPNLGINVATINFSYHHTFGKNTQLTKRENPIINTRTQIHINAGGFIKRVYPPLGKKFFAGALSVLRFKPFTNKSAWGIGADIFYDNSISYRIITLERKPGSLDNIRPGLFTAYHLSVGQMGVMFNMGYYLYNTWKDDGNIYHRLCLRYYFEKIYLCLNLKTHYARADFVEFGLGYRIKK